MCVGWLRGKLMSALSPDTLCWWVWAPQRAGQHLWPGGTVGAASRFGWALKLASAHYSLRNVTAVRYLGNHVTLRLVECAGVEVGSD